MADNFEFLNDSSVELDAEARAQVADQMRDGDYQIVTVTCLQPDGRAEKREELMSLVRATSCKIIFVNPVFPYFAFIIFKGLDNPLEAHMKDFEVYITITKVDCNHVTAPPISNDDEEDEEGEEDGEQ